MAGMMGLLSVAISVPQGADLWAQTEIPSGATLMDTLVSVDKVPYALKCSPIMRHGK